ncbi:aminoglycoside phosphotransferase family protein [Kitasatospora cinereorecta]|uniref:Aminoglycoside phosphotransferase family protein n=1 Tax=Kitasatospora cinereorecta TaxID=285560 RepID=A0ABW0V769_9ACTN
MHEDEPDIDAGLVRRLIAAQFPQWAGLPVAEVDSAGTSNAIYRLGDALTVRLPRRSSAAQDVETEHRWLPRLGPLLPVAVPVPVERGEPGAHYPWAWSVHRWIDGTNPAPGAADSALLADDLARFATALHRVDPAGAPPSYRSEPLAARDAATRSAVAALHGEVDADAALALWDDALRAPARPGAGVWIHADLQSGNLLTSGGRLAAVIDFGCAGVGDPAVDLLAAWYVLPASARVRFRDGLGADEAMWRRGRGWALSVALMELSYYRDTNPVMVANARHVIGELLADGAPAS